MQLHDFECPNCGASQMEPAEDGQLLCLFCDTRFGEVERICPECGHYNDEGVRHCSQCGTQLVRDCTACGADNWVLADHCVVCGRNLDLIENMARRWQKTTQQRLNDRRQGMTALKEAEERASQERMAGLLEAERKRQEAINLARETQRQRDRQLYIIGALILLAFVVLVIVAVLLRTL